MNGRASCQSLIRPTGDDGDRLLRMAVPFNDAAKLNDQGASRIATRFELLPNMVGKHPIRERIRRDGCRPKDDRAARNREQGSIAKYSRNPLG